MLGVFLMVCAYFHHVNEASCSSGQWLNWIMPCTGDSVWEFETRLEHYEQAEHDIRALLCSPLTWKQRHSMALWGTSSTSFLHKSSLSYFHIYLPLVCSWLFILLGHATLGYLSAVHTSGASGPRAGAPRVRSVSAAMSLIKNLTKRQSESHDIFPHKTTTSVAIYLFHLVQQF